VIKIKNITNSPQRLTVVDASKNEGEQSRDVLHHPHRTLDYSEKEAETSPVTERIQKGIFVVLAPPKEASSPDSEDSAQEAPPEKKESKGRKGKSSS